MDEPETKTEPVLSAALASDIDLFCQPCEQNSAKLPAFGYCLDCDEHLCTSCFNSHKKAKPCRNHTLLSKDVMPKSIRRSSTFLDEGQEDSFTKTCPKHNKEIIRFLCQQHNVLLCPVCGMLEHRSCEIKYIPDITGLTELINKTQVPEKLEELLHQCQTIKLEVKSATDESNSSLQQVQEEFKALKEQNYQTFDELEKKLEEETLVLKEENKTKLTKREEICNKTVRSIQKLSDSIERLRKFGKPEMLFVELKTAEHELQNYESAITDLRKYTIRKNYTFQEQSHSAISEFVENARHLTILVKQPHDIIFAKAPDDTEICDIRQMVVQNNHLIMLDAGNNSVKMVNINNNNITSIIRSPMQLYDITEVTNDEVAITLPFAKKIQFLSSATNKLTLTRSLKVNENCYGISSYKKKLVVIYRHPSKLEILDMSGTVLNSFTVGPEVYAIIGTHNNSNSVEESDSTDENDETDDNEGTEDNGDVEDSKGADNFKGTGFTETSDNTEDAEGSEGTNNFEGTDDAKNTQGNTGSETSEVPDNNEGAVDSKCSKDSEGNEEVDDVFLANVECNSNAIYVSDTANNAIIKLDWQGEATGIDTGYSSLKGFALKENEQLLVSDSFLGNVFEESSDSDQVTLQLTGLDCPYAICCDKQNVYISSCSFKESNDNYINVYRL